MHELCSGVGSADGLRCSSAPCSGHVERLDHALQSFRAEGQNSGFSEFGTRIESPSEQRSAPGGETHALRSAWSIATSACAATSADRHRQPPCLDEALAAAVERWLASRLAADAGAGTSDWFKRINDRLGHAAGDRVPTGVAHPLAGACAPRTRWRALRR